MKKDQLSLKFLEEFYVRFVFEPFPDNYSLEEVNKFFQSDRGKTALMLSSDVMSTKLNSFDSSNAALDNKLIKFQYSLLKYYLRAHTRPTPYGLYAGMDCVNWNDSTNLTFETKKKTCYTTNSCLDIDLMHFFLTQIKKFPAIMSVLNFAPTPTLYKLGNQYRYTEKLFSENKKKYELSAFDYDEFYTNLFSFSKYGKGIDELVFFTSHETGIETSEAVELIQQLIESGVLEDNFELGISGGDMLDQFEDHILFAQKVNDQSTVENKDLNFLIETAFFCIKKIREFDSKDDLKADVLTDIYQVIGNKFPKFNTSNIVQVNTLPCLTKNHLNREIQKKLKKCILLLAKLSSAPKQKSLDKFMSDFINKYGDQRIPILKALDPENGILYGNLTTDQMDKNPFLSDLYFRNFNEKGSNIELTNSDYFLLGKLNDALRSNSFEISLFEKDFTKNQTRGAIFLPTIPIAFSVYNSKNEPIIKLHNVGQSSAVNMITRFHTQDNNISNTLAQVSNIEKNYYADQIIAEIVHLPEARMGNVVHRPLFRDYDLIYLGKSSQPEDRQINIDEIEVCVENDQIRLYSSVLKKYIIPRLSNAHNYDIRTTQIYQFLCHLQFQSKRDGIYFSWGNLEHFFDHLPRVTIEGVIVAPEKWRIHYNQIKEMQKTTDLRSYFKENALPIVFLLIDGDNYLPFDLHNKLSCELFINEIKSKKTIEIEEQFNFQQSILKNELEMGISHEFLCTVYQDQYNNPEVTQSKYLDNNEVKSKFNLGSEWLYLKIKSGVKTAELILVNVIIPFMVICNENDWVKKWFFIKYNDPENHLRIRFLLKSYDKLHMVLGRLNSLLEEHQFSEICKLEVAEYERELTRYDPNLIEETEDLFCLGSKLVLDVLSLELTTEIDRWKWAVVWCDVLFDKFLFSLIDKMEIMVRLGQSFLLEHGFNTNQRKQLDKKFRSLEPSMYQIITSNSFEREKIERHYAISETFEIVNEAFKSKKVAVNKWDYVGSIIHMELNRLFRSNQRKNEMVIYYCMGKMYKSLIARNSNR